MITKQYQALVVFDLDGTLLRGLTVCEVLAEALDRLPRLRELERLRERQDIVAAREEMALWYRDTARESLLKTLDRSQRAPGFFEGMSLLHSCDVAVGIASITWDFAVSHFAQQLSVEHYLATRLQDSGAIDHVWPEEKARRVLGLAARLGVPPERTAAVGDSHGDYEMLAAVDTSFFVGEARASLLQNWLHWPAADIEHVARHLIQRWALHPATPRRRGARTMDHRQVSDTWERGSPYEQYVGRWSRGVAPLFLSWLSIPPGRRWLDVGCGTGALCAAIVDRCSPSSVVGVEPSEGFLRSAKENLAVRAALHQGSATAIPLGDASVDVVVSGLVLNFVPDQRAALLEMARVAGQGGTIAAYVWDYAGRMELMRFFWDAAVELDPAAATMDEGVRFPLCRPEALERLFTGAGLEGVEVKPIDIPTPFASFDDYWQPFLGGQGPAPAYAMSLDEAARGRLRDRIRERIPTAANGAISLIARAWAIRATTAT